ncbi:hypothetical protein DFH11DRAFT_1548215 [Phellopilus nigrolimitatus]|nr:hypothetical protein DFH11DRAFT_1553944 [Phellopilus nigrolimitatus]KAH8109604.1 hypothetical protein DFH11DRAFT_1548215 [Phellopilus nigrolimitatus]
MFFFDSLRVSCQVLNREKACSGSHRALFRAARHIAFRELADLACVCLVLFFRLLETLPVRGSSSKALLTILGDAVATVVFDGSDPLPVVTDATYSQAEIVSKSYGKMQP